MLFATVGCKKKTAFLLNRSNFLSLDSFFSVLCSHPRGITIDFWFEPAVNTHQSLIFDLPLDP